MNEIRLFIPGELVGKERPRVVFRGNSAKAFTPEKTATYENLVKMLYRNRHGDFRFPDDAALFVEIVAVYPIPKGTSKKREQLMMSGDILPTKKPDGDNIAKAVCDALNLVAYKDDAQITSLYVSKIYTNEYANPGVYVKIGKARPFDHLPENLEDIPFLREGDTDG